MEFPDLIQEKEKLIENLVEGNESSRDEIKIVASPYRISPLGAHIDHQGGPVLGITINAYTLLAYVPNRDRKIILHSLNYPGTVEFDLHQILALTAGDWGNYAWGAVRVLGDEFRLERGITGILKGTLPESGLSSSASVILSYLYALAEANRIKLKPWDYVRLAQRVENDYLRLNNGILDQTSIIFGQENHLLYIDTVKQQVIPEIWKQPHLYRILIAHSGYTRDLPSTDYNSRVQECREAARRLSRLAGLPPAEILSGISEESFHQHGKKLDLKLYLRASHFFSEVQRVHKGMKAWKVGRLEDFGKLMFESCKSSIEMYESGSNPIKDLQHIVSSTEGVIGSRFSGGGFGGCVLGFVKSSLAKDAVVQIGDTYLKHHPEVADKAAIYLANSVNGVDFL